MDCSHLESLIYPTTKLALFLDRFDIKFLDYLCKTMIVDREWIIKTRCLTTSESVSYLLNSHNSTLTRSISFDKLHKIVLQVTSLDGEEIGIDHVFHLIPDNGKLIWFDSYMDCRLVSCFKINRNFLIKQLNKLRLKVDTQLWTNVTGCLVEGFPDNEPMVTKITITASDYSFEYIDENFWKLIDMARIKLQQGVDDIHLSFLSPSLNEDKAEQYLDSLTNLIPNRSWIRKMKSYVY